jgi:hypothetical protein
MSISSTRPQSASACTGLSPPKVTVSAACTAGPVMAPVATSMPLGVSTATTGMPAASTAANTSAAAGRKRARAGDAHHAVEDEIGCRRDALHDAAAGLAGTPASARAVGAVGVEQHRVGGRAATAQERGRPQRVTAVIPGADDRAYPATRNPARAGGQLADDHGGQPVSRALHQGTIGQAGQQRRFGVADRVYGVVMPHPPACSSARSRSCPR